MSAEGRARRYGIAHAIDIGHDVLIAWDSDGTGFLWHHEGCEAWASLCLMPSPRSTGHRLLAGGPDDMAHLTIEGSLLCPMGCGAHGFVREGAWCPA